MEKVEAFVQSWGLLLGAIVIGVAWIIVTSIQRSCQHEWKPYGDRLLDHHLDCDNMVRKIVKQPVRCTKCGRLTWFNIG